MGLWTQQGKEKGEANWESNTEIHTLYVKQMANGKLLCNTRAQPGAM